ncbi:thymidine phosphorylase [Candidatus Micrarchaeota archaeon]|nr:thymidine phosphorylase [Candidatus Micrarchaeota archaeon]
MKFKTLVFEIEHGRNEVVLTEEQAEKIGVKILDRVKITRGNKTVNAIVDVCASCVGRDQIGVFSEVAKQLGLKDNTVIEVNANGRPASLDYIRKKLDGGTLEAKETKAIIEDLMSENLSKVELAIFIAAVYTRGMNTDETVGLTNAIYSSGGRLKFPGKTVVSQHGIGGVAGDRTSMLLVPIIASLGITIPKSASRAISSSAGTADVMETLCKVDFPLEKVMKIVKKTNGCLIWGGNVGLAAADDKLIQIRNPLHLDPKALLLSSILAKKKAEGAEMALIDLPIGRGTKMKNKEEAIALANEFRALGAKLGMRIECTITDGSEPMMPFIGPQLEAQAVMKMLKGEMQGELLEKSLVISSYLYAMAKDCSREEAYKICKQALVSGKAYKKMLEIIEAQEGNPKININNIVKAKYNKTLYAKTEGKISHIDNHDLSLVARTLGSPKIMEAGIELHKMKGDRVKKGDALLTLYSKEKIYIEEAEKVFSKLNVIEIGNIVMQVV